MPPYDNIFESEHEDLPTISPKIVRDNIPSFVKKSERKDIEFGIMKDSDFYIGLKDKLVEEVKELRAASGEHEIEEFADVFEVLDRLVQIRGKQNNPPINIQTMRKRIQQKQKDKRSYKGGFNKNLFMYITSIIS